MSDTFHSQAEQVQKVIDVYLLGEKYTDSLERINEVLTERDFAILKKIATPQTPDLFAQFRRYYARIFEADGYAINFTFGDRYTELEKDAKDYLDKCWNGLSLKEFMLREWSRFNDEEPNAVIVMETPVENSELPEPFPKVYSWERIEEIRRGPGGIKYLVLKWTDTTFRVIDRFSDGIFRKEKAGGYTPITKIDRDGDEVADVIYHNLGFVPAILCGQYDLSRKADGAVTNQYHWGLLRAPKFQDLCNDHDMTVKYHAFPIGYAYGSNCRACEGRGTRVYPGKTLEVDCHICHGSGEVPFASTGPKEMVKLPMPQNVGFDTPMPALHAPIGYAERPIELISKQQELKLDGRKEIEIAVMGAPGIFERKGTNTATESLLDYQPVQDRLNDFADRAEAVEEFLTKTICTIRYNTTVLTVVGEIREPAIRFVSVDVHYGRKYRLRGVEQIALDYEIKKKAGLPTFVLEAELREMIETKWEYNPSEKARALYMLEIEPFPAYSLSEVVALQQSADRDLKVKQYLDVWIKEIEAEKDVLITSLEPEVVNELLTEKYNAKFGIEEDPIRRVLSEANGQSEPN